ncbi:uncharacterized protein LOC114330102 [Diabrotica virgifera virgifera]|uniref:Uncharacterized protein LOC114330102 n=1 Tax=Diabrotica virgifera virgifera TaxID=50390 RepID=A0A6P7FQN5_DIAVI|nr:uncharacterized protein LOC114330102 [Diabrotica virgifera virgifera]
MKLEILFITFTLLGVLSLEKNSAKEAIEQREKREKFRQDCKNQYGLKQIKFPTSNATDEKVADYYICYLKKIGIVTDDDKFDNTQLKHLINNFNSEIVPKDITDRCSDNEKVTKTNILPLLKCIKDAYLEFSKYVLRKPVVQ